MYCVKGRAISWKGAFFCGIDCSVFYLLWLLGLKDWGFGELRSLLGGIWLQVRI